MSYMALNVRTKFESGGFRPIGELTEQLTPFEMLLWNGDVVVGWLIIGVPTPAARSYWTRSGGTGDLRSVRPEGFRSCIETEFGRRAA